MRCFIDAAYRLDAGVVVRVFDQQAKEYFKVAKRRQVEAPALSYQEVLAGRAEVCITSNVEASSLVQNYPELAIVPVDRARSRRPASLLVAQEDVVWQDVDVAVDRVLQIAVPQANADLPKALEALNVGFLPVPGLNPKAPGTSFKVRGRSLRVDLLTPARGPRDGKPVHIERLKAAAQPLELLDYLLESALPVPLVNGGASLVNVPDPARFALHKVIKSKGRRTANKPLNYWKCFTRIAAATFGWPCALSSGGAGGGPRAYAGQRRSCETNRSPERKRSSPRSRGLIDWPSCSVPTP